MGGTAEPETGSPGRNDDYEAPKFGSPKPHLETIDPPRNWNRKPAEKTKNLLEEQQPEDKGEAGAKSVDEPKDTTPSNNKKNKTRPYVVDDIEIPDEVGVIRSRNGTIVGGVRQKSFVDKYVEAKKLEEAEEAERKRLEVLRRRQILEAAPLEVAQKAEIKDAQDKSNEANAEFANSP